MSSINQTSKTQSAKLLAKMSEMRDSQTLTDVSLKVGEKLFNAHRVVLAASSDYFCAMFTAGMRESFDELIELKDSSVTPESLAIILDSVYKSKLDVTKENVLEVLVAADHLQMKGVIEQCSEFVLEEIVSEQLNNFDMRSLQKMLNTAESHSLCDLQEEVHTRMAAVFKELSETKEFLDYISVDQLLNLLQRNNLTAPSENFVFRSVVKWIDHNKNERLGHAAALFKAVRLGLVDVGVLITELKREDLRGNKECWNILHEASLYNNMPTLLQELTLINSEPRTTSSVLIAVEMNTPLEFYDVIRKTWLQFGQNVPITENCFAVTSFGNFIYVGGIQRVYRYSIDSNTWDELPIMRHSKGEYPYQLIVLGEYLYAIGNSPERYSFSEKTWELIDQLTEDDEKNGWTAANLDGCIYAVGYTNTLSFEESKNQWVKKPNNLRNRISCYAFGYKGKLIIAGGKIYSPNEKSRQTGRSYSAAPSFPAATTVEAYYRESDHWSQVVQKHSFSSPFSKLAIEVDNTVFIKLNNFVFHCGVKVSPDAVYPVNLDEWKNVTQLSSDALVTYAPVNTKKLLDNSGED